MPASSPTSATTPRRRVVVTGMGCVSPLGRTAQETWDHALLGRSGIRLITRFSTETFPVKIAGEIPWTLEELDQALWAGRKPIKPWGSEGAEVSTFCPPKDLKKFGRFTHLALLAGVEAYQDSGLDQIRDKLDPTRLGVNIGVGMGGLQEIEKVWKQFQEGGFRRITPFFIPQAITNLASGQLSITLNAKGPNLCNTTACTSSAHSLGESMRLIARGEADVMVAGGSESTISEMGIGGFAAMRALSTRNDDPEGASRPFDQGRDGFVMGEGSAVLILEELVHAQSRGARIYAELVGYGASGDAYHITSPSPGGEGGSRAMKLALQDAGLKGSEIDYINAHGTSTPAGDPEELKAILALCGHQGLHISSTKSMTGHLLGAAGAIEAMFSVLACVHGKIPPTRNLLNPDPEIEEALRSYPGVSLTPHHTLEKHVNAALSNSFGFGGTNGSLIFKRWVG